MKAVGTLQVKPSPTHVKKKRGPACHPLTRLNSPTFKVQASAKYCEQNPSGITRLQHKTKILIEKILTQAWESEFSKLLGNGCGP